MKMTGTVLDRILLRKHEEVIARRAAKSLAQLQQEARAQAPARGFIRALQGKLEQNLPAVIAEVKRLRRRKV